MDEKLVYYLAGVPLLGISAQFLAYWLRLPSILLLLAFGILLGTFVNLDEILSDVGGSDPQFASRILFPIVSLSVGVILFEGGLSLQFVELKSSGRIVARLCSLGALITWVLSGALAWLVFGLDARVACLLGAVLIVTGPTVVAPLLRHIRPSGRVGSIIKWEGIVIDPIGAVVAVLVFEYFFLAEERSGWSAILNLVLTTTTGILLGLAGAAVLVVLLKRYWIPDHLHGVSVLSTAISVFAFSNYLEHESGLVAVTVMGICLANQRQATIEHIVEFKENLGVFLISCLFIVLGSRLDVGDLISLGWPGLLFLLLMILLIRPISVFLSLWRTDATLPEKVFLSSMAPRGIVAAAVVSVFSLRLQVIDQGAEGNSEIAASAQLMVPITFLVIVGTVAVYGLSAAPIARRLGLADVRPQGVLFAGAQRWVCDLALTLKSAGFSVAVVDTNYSRVSRARMDGLQARCFSILSEQLHEELDFAGIGRMLAVTNNDGINALATQEFAHFFGRKNAYQLPPHDADSGARTSIDPKLRGRELFDNSFHEDRFWTLYQQGYRFKRTLLTEEFTVEDFRQMYGEDIPILFVVDQNQNLLIATIDQPLVPVAGQAVITMAPPSAKPSTEAGSSEALAG